MGKKASHDIAPTIRGAFIRAAKRLENDGKPLSDILYDSLKEKPLETLNAISRFIIRESTVTGNVKHDHKHTHEPISESSEWIAGLLGTTKSSAIKKPGTH